MAPEYTIEKGARDLLKTLCSDPRLQIDPAILAACDKVQYSGYTTPWLPVPFKFSEGAGALNALAAAGAALIAKERYGIDQQVVSNTDKGSINLFGFFVPRVDGVFIVKSSPAFVEAAKEADFNDIKKPIHWGIDWLDVALSKARTIAARFRISPSSFGTDSTLVKRLLWSCAIRDTILTLGCRGFDIMQKNMIDVPMLLPQDLDSPMSYSRVHDSDSKQVLVNMVVMLAELTRVSNKCRPLQLFPTETRDPAHMSEDWVRDRLLAIERACIDMAIWKRAFMAGFGRVRISSRSPESTMVVFHRNCGSDSLLITMNVPHQMYFDMSLSNLPMTVASMAKCSWERAKRAAGELNDLVKELTDLGFSSTLPLTIPTSIVHGCFIFSLHGLFSNLDHAAGTSRRVNACFDALQAAKGRCRGLRDIVAILEAAAQHAKQEINSHCMEWQPATDPDSGSELSIDENPEVVSCKGRIMLETVAFLTVSLSNGELLDVPVAKDAANSSQ